MTDFFTRHLENRSNAATHGATTLWAYPEASQALATIIQNGRFTGMQNLSDEEEEEDLSEGDSMTGENYTSLHMFLAATGLSQWSPAFVKEKIDLDALMLLSEADLSDSLGMPLGSRRKLMKAIKDKEKASVNTYS